KSVRRLVSREWKPTIDRTQPLSRLPFLDPRYRAGFQIIYAAHHLHLPILHSRRQYRFQSFEPLDSDFDILADRVVQWIARHSLALGHGWLEQFDQAVDRTRQGILGIDMFNSGLDGAAAAVSENHNQGYVQLGHGVFDAALYRDTCAADHIAGHPNYE